MVGIYLARPPSNNRNGFSLLDEESLRLVCVEERVGTIPFCHLSPHAPRERRFPSLGFLACRVIWPWCSSPRVTLDQPNREKGGQAQENGKPLLSRGDGAGSGRLVPGPLSTSSASRCLLCEGACLISSPNCSTRRLWHYAQSPPSRASSHQTPDKLIQRQLKQLVPHPRATLVLDRRERVLDDCVPSPLANNHVYLSLPTPEDTYHTRPTG